MQTENIKEKEILEFYTCAFCGETKVTHEFWWNVLDPPHGPQCDDCFKEEMKIDDLVEELSDEKKKEKHR